jgi:molecular chaperone DnaK
MKIGIDFGTTYTKIALLDQQGNLQCFQYPPPPAQHTHIPTAVAYREEDGQPVISIGYAARSDVLNKSDIQFGENFKMLLPLKPEQWTEHGWNIAPAPAEVVRDYLRQLLFETDGSFERIHGQIESLIVSVPEVWQRTVNIGAETLRRVLVEDLQLPVDRLQSEPVCAAAFFVYEYQRTERRSQSFNLLVCDMGGGTFDVALCNVSGHRVEVLAFDGNGAHGIGSAGVQFDRCAVSAAYEQVHGTRPDLKDPEFVELIRAFEETKLAQAPAVKKRLRLLQKKASTGVGIEDTPLYEWRKKYRVTYEQVQHCFAPIREGITQVLTRIQKRAQEEQWSIDRVAMVGGFSQFPLVEQTILDGLGIHTPDDVRFSQTLNDQQRFYAIANGAALIANGKIQPIEYYPHTLEIIAHVERPELMEVALTMVEAGKIPGENAKPYYAQLQGKRVPITIKHQYFKELPVRIRLSGRGAPTPLKLSKIQYPPPGRYYVGVLIDRSNIGTLIFEPLDTQPQKRYEYTLGEISPSLIVEEA